MKSLRTELRDSSVSFINQFSVIVLTVVDARGVGLSSRFGVRFTLTFQNCSSAAEPSMLAAKTFLTSRSLSSTDDFDAVDTTETVMSTLMSVLRCLSGADS